MSIPLVISIEQGPRKFVPYEYLPQNINFADFRNDKYYWFIPEGKNEGRWVPKSNYTQIEDGKFTGFYWNGKLREKGTVFNNKIIDTLFVYDLNEKLIKYLIHSKDTVIQYYINDGKFKDFFADGKLFEEGIVEDHKVGSEWKTYFNSGVLQTYTSILNDVKIRKDNFENGQIHYSGKEKNGVLDGRAMYYYENGQIQAVCDWKDGKQHGERITFFRNGQIETKDYFENGKTEGESVIYYENGNMKQRRYFKKDIANGELTDWYENGNIKYEGIMIDGKKSGNCHNYDDKGRIKQIGNYKNNKVHGLVQTYDSTGVIVASIVYKEGTVEKIHFNNYKE